MVFCVWRLPFYDKIHLCFSLIFSSVFSLGGRFVTRVNSFHLSQMSAFFCKMFHGGDERRFLNDVRVPVPEGHLKVVEHVKCARFEFVSTRSVPDCMWETFGKRSEIRPYAYQEPLHYVHFCDSTRQGSWFKLFLL